MRVSSLERGGARTRERSCREALRQSMERIVECVPNFSEGRKEEVVRALVEAVESVAGALVLGTHVDPDHNRSVITFVAPPETIVEAAVRVVRRAAELIDMSG